MCDKACQDLLKYYVSFGGAWSFRRGSIVKCGETPFEEFTWIHTVDQLANSAKNERLLWLAGMKYVKIRTYCKA